MHTLFTRPETGGFSVHAALEQSGVEYRLVTIDKGDSGDDYDEFASLSLNRVQGNGRENSRASNECQ